MPLTGTLRSWNDDRGFGFIAPMHGGREIFVHVSAFPRDGTRPTVGEVLTYELGRGKDGQPQATKVIRSAVGSSPPARRSTPSGRSTGFGLKALLLSMVLVVAASAFGYHHYQQRRVQALIGTPSTASFQCDGRTQCSQMTSCSEAKYFLKHCPGVQMDGNGDGLPCEQQWCN